MRLADLAPSFSRGALRRAGTLAAVGALAVLATCRVAAAAPSPCTVTPNGSGWNISCASNPPTLIPQINQTFNGGTGGGGSTGAIVIPPGDGGTGGNGGNVVFTFPVNPGSQAIEFPGHSGRDLHRDGRGHGRRRRRR